MHDAEFGQITVKRYAQSRSYRLHIRGSEIIITMPKRGSEGFAKKLLDQHRSWVREKLRPQQRIEHGDKLGHKFDIEITEGLNNRRRLTGESLRIAIAPGQDDATLQAFYRESCIAFLRRKAKEQLIPRLAELSEHHGIAYTTATVKQMTSRWGSCSTTGAINLSLFLVQHSQEVIDYVLVHELCHIPHPNHSADFWAEVASKMPEYQAPRSRLKTVSPDLLINQWV